MHADISNVICRIFHAKRLQRLGGCTSQTPAFRDSVTYLAPLTGAYSSAPGEDNSSRKLCLHNVMFNDKAIKCHLHKMQHKDIVKLCVLCLLLVLCLG